jgi:hypothetical protein
VLTAVLMKIHMFLEVMLHHRVLHNGSRALQPSKLWFLFTHLKCHVPEKFNLRQQYFDYIHLFTYIYIYIYIHIYGRRRQTPTTHITSICEPSYVISFKYKLSLPDDGSYVIRNLLE